MKKRLLIGILAASMTMSMGVTAFAAESTPVPENQVSSSTETYAAQKAVLLENARNYYKEKFNVSAYKKANPDLVPIYGDDENAYLEHYLTCGIYEGRRTGTGFDPIAYIINNFEFYMQNGLTGGSSFFNADEFMRWHPEIAANLNNDPAACLIWYLQYGVINGVSSNAKFDVVEFAKKYPDAEARSNITPDLALVADKVEQTNAIIKEKGYDYYINFYVDGTDKVNKNITVSKGSSNASAGSGSASETGNESTEAGSETGSENTGIIINNDYPSEWSSKATSTNVNVSVDDSENEAVSNIYHIGDAYILDLLNMNEDEINGFVENLLDSIELVETKSTNYFVEGDYQEYIDSVKPVEDKKFDLVANYDFKRDDAGKAVKDNDGYYLYSDKVLSYTVYFPINHTEKNYSDNGSYSEITYEYNDGTVTQHIKYTNVDGESQEYSYSYEDNPGIWGFNLYGEKIYYKNDNGLTEYDGANRYEKDHIQLYERFELNESEGTVNKDPEDMKNIILVLDEDGKATVDENKSSVDIIISNPEDYRTIESDTEEEEEETTEETSQETTEGGEEETSLEGTGVVEEETPQETTGAVEEGTPQETTGAAEEETPQEITGAVEEGTPQEAPEEA